MSQALLADALASGALVVTPNNRLARSLAARFDAARQASGDRAWSAAALLPWSLWLDRLWLAGLAAGATRGTALLEAGATRELWHVVIRDGSRRVVNTRGAARQAMEAWTLFHAWRVPNESLDAVCGGAPGDDAQAFAAWARRYRERLAALAAIDHALLPDALATIAPAIARATPRVVLHGFLPMTAQQQRLIDALRAAGMAIDTIALASRASATRTRTSAATPVLEAAQALAFARTRVAADPDAHVAIVVANLHERRDEIVALAEEILCPEHLLSAAPDIVRPYGVSLGAPLASAPIVASALALIAVANADVDATIASAAIRSPFLPDASAKWVQRAGIERIWRAGGRRRVGWRDVVAALRDADAALHARWRAADPPASAARLPREWARVWSDWLADVGWPGTATLGSGQWQARDAWSNVLARFAGTGAVTGALAAGAALDTLRTLLDDTLFQPEAPPAAIQILGSLEAVGLAFEHAWLAGFDAQRWPPAAAPNPFLPIGWQWARDVPRGHPDASLANARLLTSALTSIADEIVVSHAQMIDDAPSMISPLFADWPVIDEVQRTRATRIADAMPAAALERIADSRAPALVGNVGVRGGAQLFDSQSACPFQAFARFRLNVEAWAACPDGLSAAERGVVLHAMLSAFWNDVGDHATLASLAPAALTLRIDAAIERGMAKLAAARWRALPPAIAVAEAHRLAATLRAWIIDAELPRPPFVVKAHEQAVELDVDGIRVRVRIDRIDALPSGGVAIIDYKSGRVIGPPRWFASRPEGVQLAVYAQAVDAQGDGPVRALAFAQLKAGEIEVSGLAESAELWPVLDVAGASRAAVRDWPDARSQLRERLTMLAREFRDGVAQVAPRRASTCQYCGLQPLCRIRMLDDGAASSAAADD
jgi:probable DNA repair protein